MNYHIEIENLGAIKKAEFEISPMTILAGKNGTGKSFVTKFLYSVLSLNETKFINHCLSKFFETKKFLKYLIIELGFEHENQELIDFHDYLNISYRYIQEKSNENIFSLMTELKKIFFNDISWFNDRFNQEILPTLYHENKSKVDNSNTNTLLKLLQDLVDLTKDPHQSYIQFLTDYLKIELIENFQISEINKLIRFNSHSAIFTINKNVHIIIWQDNNIKITISSNNPFEHLPNNKIVFFESPVYWKLLTIINENDDSNFIDYNILTGVPQHFYDLKELVFTNFKNNERPQFIIDCANNLEQSLQGKFRTTLGSDLVFENKQGQAIDKSLVSFGMTNLGILQAVLNKNIINKGSFIFIDEPESNLHPEWQTLLAETLVYLAKNGVYVIITSHSTDMLKAFDVATQEQKLEDKLSAHYFQMDGTLLAMNNKYLTDIEQARQKLMENYDDLTMRGYLYE